MVRGTLTAHQLIALGLPASLVVSWAAVALGADAAAWAWALFCTTSTFASLSQPAVGMAFPAGLAGRALSAYNLVMFAGVFGVQWVIGSMIDFLLARGWSVTASYQGAFALFALCCLLAYLWFCLCDDGVCVTRQRRVP